MGSFLHSGQIKILIIVVSMMEAKLYFELTLYCSSMILLRFLYIILIEENDLSTKL